MGVKWYFRSFLFFVLLLALMLVVPVLNASSAAIFGTELFSPEPQINRTRRNAADNHNSGALGFGTESIMADAQNVAVVGHIGGDANAVAVQGKYAYVGVGPTLAVFDISEPELPHIIGKTPPFPGIVQALVADGNLVYIAAGRAGLRIVDASNPTRPVEIGRYDTPGDALSVDIEGSHAYVADKDGGLSIINIGDPTSPDETAHYEIMDSYTYDVAVANDLAFIAAGWSGLRVIDVSDPAFPQEVGFSYDVGYSREVDVLGSYAYVTDGHLNVLDVSDPSAPTRTGIAEIPSGASDLIVVGDFAYVAGGNLAIFNVTNPQAPQRVGTFKTPRSARGVAVAGNKAYVSGGGLAVIDTAEASKPVMIGYYETPEAARHIALSGGFAYVTIGGGGLHIVDIANPSEPVEVGFTNAVEGPDDVAVDDNYAYVTENYGLGIVNVSDPSAPVKSGFQETPSIARHVALDGNYAYVATGGSGLRIVNLGDPAQPFESGYFVMPGEGLGVDVDGNYVYYLDEGLHVIDVADPANPAGKGFYRDWSGQDIEVAEKYAYISAGDETGGGRLHIIDVGDPEAPAETASFPMTEPATGVAISEDLAYVAYRSNIIEEPYFDSGLRVVDITNRAIPAGAGHYDTAGTGFDVATDGNYAYFADANGGLLILAYSDIAPEHGRILIDKVSEPRADSQSFNFILSGGPDVVEQDFELTDADAPWNSGDLLPGTYSVSEELPEGWDLRRVVCSDGSDPLNIDLEADELVICTFTNSKKGQIVVDLVTDPAGDETRFPFNLSGGPDGVSKDFTLNDTSPPWNSGLLKVGRYSLQETAPAGWIMTAATCDDGSAPAAIQLDAGESVKCTISYSQAWVNYLPIVTNGYGKVHH